MNRRGLELIRMLCTMVLVLIVMALFIYMYAGKIFTYFVSQDYGEAACQTALKQAEAFHFESPTAKLAAGAGVAGSVVFCVAGGILCIPGGPVGVVAGCKVGAVGGAALGGVIGGLIGAGIEDVSLLANEEVLKKCGVVIPFVINASKDNITLWLANSSVLACEYGKNLTLDRVPVIRSARVNMSGAGEVTYTDVKNKYDSIYNDLGVPSDDRCLILWRLNESQMHCTELRGWYGAMPDMATLATGKIKAGEEITIRMNYCTDSLFMGINKKHIIEILNENITAGT